jgi:TolB-like protein/DNA-binding winged helix-turn-helix (wHTH) protein/tetratricopeptide (TPR) repeat protein
MEAAAPTARVFRFGIFELDAQSGELRRHGLKIRLPDQSFQILQLLLDRPGAVVTREELRHRLWTPDTSVDFDVGVNNAVRRLREALDDSAENPRFVETLPRRGYRFIGQVRPDTTDQKPESGAGAAAASGARVRARWIAGALILAATIAALALGYDHAWWGRMRAGTAAGPIRSLAVLPFENLTGDPAQDYFSDGMTDLLTTELVQAGGFDVISRTSAMQYKGTKKPLTAIGQELTVDAVVAGAIVRSGQHVRITVRLIRAATDRHVWAKSYEGELRDAVGLEREIGRAITAAVTGRAASPPPVRVGAPQAVSPQAYDAYLKATAAAGRLTSDGFRTAVAYFEDAVARQPDFAAAYADMAQYQLQLLYGGPLSPREVIPKAEASARRALEIDHTLAQPHKTLGIILQNFYWRWEEGDKEFRRAQELSGKSAETPRAELLRTGRFEEAVADAEHTLRLDPLSFDAHVDVAVVHRAAGEYDRAIAGIRRALEVLPGQPRGHFQLGVTFMFMGRTNEAIGELETAVKSSQSNPRFQAYLGYAYAAAGRPADARSILNALESRARQQYVSSFGMALIHDALGEKEPALAAFERAYQDHAVEFAQMNQYPPFKTIASEARFHAVMRLVGLPADRRQ